MTVDEDDLTAVVAHSLLSSLHVILGATDVLLAETDAGPSDLDALLALMGTQARHVGDVLDNLVRLGDPHLVEALGQLQRD